MFEGPHCAIWQEEEKLRETKEEWINSWTEKKIFKRKLLLCRMLQQSSVLWTKKPSANSPQGSIAFLEETIANNRKKNREMECKKEACLP